MASVENMGGYVAGADRRCEWPGCAAEAGFRAPKKNGRREDPHWFCLDHVREFNANFDALKGLTPEEIAEVQAASFTWDRPTWKLGDKGAKIHDPFGLAPEALKEMTRDHRSWTRAEREALDVLGLDVTATAADIRRAYKQLVKSHHPDLNDGTSAARFHAIAAAYEKLKPRLKATAKRQKDD